MAVFDDDIFPKSFVVGSLEWQHLKAFLPLSMRMHHVRATSAGTYPPIIANLLHSVTGQDGCISQGGFATPGELPEGDKRVGNHLRDELFSQPGTHAPEDVAGEPANGRDHFDKAIVEIKGSLRSESDHSWTSNS
jgi:hypothetical protein